LKKVLLSFCVICLLPGLLFAKDVRLEYSTYLGGADGGEGYVKVAVDSSYCPYLCGQTQSDDFPTVNPYQASRAGGTNYEVFISKFSSSGSTLIYSTYLGGESSENYPDIAVDRSGCACVAGTTDSVDFPTVNPYQASNPGGDDGSAEGFVTKLSSTGSELIFSTYLGGGDDEDTECYSIAVNSNLNVYVIGATGSPAFPTVNPYQASKADSGWRPDVFVTKFAPSGSTLIYSTYLGGTDTDEGHSIALDSEGRAYLTGWTNSSAAAAFPLINAYQTSFGGDRDAFVGKLSSSGSILLYSTYLGGVAKDEGVSIAVDQENSAYVTGWTKSTEGPAFPTTINAYQSILADGTDAFISKFTPSGSSLIFSTYLGGSSYDYGYGIRVGRDQSVYVAGQTSSNDFPTENPYQAGRPGGGFSSFFISRFSSTGSSLFFSTYLGGSSNDNHPDLDIDLRGRIYVVGDTASNDFPTVDPYQAGRAGNGDAVLSILFQPPPASATHTDYNGDGTSDIAIFRESSGLWAIRGISRFYFGTVDDEPVPGDYNGDGTTEGGIFRPTSELWALRGVSRIYFGGSSDELVPGDYDGDRTWEAGIFRPSSGLWAIREVTRLYFGGSNDTPIPSDYEIEGVKQIGIFRGSTGLWAARGFTRIYYGAAGDIPLPANYDIEPGYLTSEPAIFRPTSGLWAIIGKPRVYYGGASDSPVPADYIGNSADNIAIFRPSSGLWAVRNITRVYFGGSGDQAVTE
jgi:beta-propeller repeat-containing protein